MVKIIAWATFGFVTIKSPSLTTCVIFGELFFNTTIVSDPIGNEIPSAGNGTTILIGNQGDINADGELNVLDIVYTVNMVLAGEYDTIADVNEDGELNVLDVVLLVDWVLYP